MEENTAIVVEERKKWKQNMICYQIKFAPKKNSVLNRKEFTTLFHSKFSFNEKKIIFFTLVNFARIAWKNSHTHAN